MDIEAGYRVYRRKSKEYKYYIESTIAAYNSNGKKTLLFVCDNAYPVVDGVWRVLENCVAELCENYPQYNLILLAPGLTGNVYVKHIPVLAVKSIYLRSLHYQMACPGVSGQVKRWLRKLRIDLIHCHSPFFCGLFARKLHLRRKIPMITTFHSQFKQDMLKSTHSRFLTKIGMSIIMKVFKSSNEVWTMHTASRETLFSYGFKGQCRLMPNATAMKPPANYQQLRDDFRQGHNLQNKIMFVFVGRIVTQKGILFIVDVLKKLKDRGIDFVMYYVGDGPDEGKLASKVHSCKLEDCVKFVHYLNTPEHLIPYYAAADLFLFPSLYDVSSIVQIEAATCHTATVFAQGSVTSCTVTHNQNGYIFPHDVDAYADGVEQVIRSGEYTQMGENALRELHIEWADIVAESTRIYEEFMEKFPPKK